MSSDQAYYNKGFDKLVSDTHAWRTVSNAVSYTIPYLKKSDRLLDVGLGPGTILKDFANYVNEVVGVEPTQELIDIASSQPGLKGKVLFQLALVLDLPFEDNSFDVVHALQVIIHLNDPITALKEMLRVCKPGGYVLVKDADSSMTVIYPEKYSEAVNGIWLNALKDLSTLLTAGRMLKERAINAGYDPQKIKMSGLVWFESTTEERARWADMFSKRIKEGKRSEYSSRKETLQGQIEALQDWKNDDSGVLLLVHAELVYKKE